MKLRRFDTKKAGSVRAFALSIANNLDLAEKRRKRPQNGLDDIHDQLEDPGADDPQDPEKRAGRAEELDIAINALDRINPRYARILLDSMEKPKGQICKEMGTSPSVFDNLIYRARTAWRKVFYEMVRQGVTH